MLSRLMVNHHSGSGCREITERRATRLLFGIALLTAPAWGQVPIPSALESWVSIKSNPDPKTLFRGGTAGFSQDPSTNTIYVCRGTYQGNVHPGKYLPPFKNCYIEFGGSEVILTDFEVLTNFSGFWVATSGGAIPKGAYAVGSESGQTMYSCRAYLQGGIEVGKTRAQFGACNISLNGAAYTPSKYEVLVNPWSQSTGADVAAELKTGTEAPPDSQSLYTCRAPYQGAVHLGKFRSGIGCAIGYSNQGVQINRFEVLTTTMNGQWIAASNGSIPASAFQGGIESPGNSSVPQYLCRASQGGGVHPGKISQGLPGCQIQYGFANGQLLQAIVPDYEVLVVTPTLQPGLYRIHTKSTGKFWVEGTNQLVGTTVQDNTNFARFNPQAQAGGSYKVTIQADNKWLHEDGSVDKLVSTRYQPDDDFVQFFFEQQSDASYRIRVKADNRYLENANGDGTISTRAQTENDFARFFLEPSAAVTGGAPVVNRFSATPTVLAVGDTLTLSWDVTGADTVTINSVIDGTVLNPTIGTYANRVLQAGTFDIVLTARNGFGTVTKTATVTVSAAPLPVINKFVSDHSTITPGFQTAYLTWDVSNATTVSIDNGIGQVAASGSRQVAPTATATYTLTATNSAGSVTATVTITSTVQPSNRPVINAHGVVTVAAGTEVLTPLALVSIYGLNFTNGITQQWDSVARADPSRLNTTLAGVTVTVDGKPAYPLFVSPTFINIQVPDTTTRGPVKVTVSNANGTSDGALVTMSSVAPEFKGWPKGYVEALRAGTTPGAPPTIVAPSGLLPGSAPAQPGEHISLWALGFGASNPPVAAGLIGTPAVLANQVQLTIGGTPATVEYAGLQGVGLYQFNVIVPPSLADGEYDVVATVADTRTLNTMKLAVKR